MDEIRSKAAEALERAADAFESGALKWVQGSLGWAEYGTACARGGLFHALTGNQRMGNNTLNKQFRHIATAAERAMGFDEVNPGPMPDGTLPSWNDVEGRTVQDVIDRMKEGAKRLRNGELD